MCILVCLLVLRSRLLLVSLLDVVVVSYQVFDDGCIVAMVAPLPSESNDGAQLDNIIIVFMLSFLFVGCSACLLLVISSCTCIC